MEWYPSITKTFLRPTPFQYCSWQGLSAMLVSPGKGSCRHHRLARALACCHCKQWVPGRLIGVGSFRLTILQQNPIFIMNCENNGFLIITYLWFVNFKCIFKKKWIKKKYNFVNWFTPFYVLIRPDVIWKIYHVHYITSISPWYTPIHGLNTITPNPWEPTENLYKSRATALVSWGELPHETGEVSWPNLKGWEAYLKRWYLRRWFRSWRWSKTLGQAKTSDGQVRTSGLQSEASNLESDSLGIIFVIEEWVDIRAARRKLVLSTQMQPFNRENLSDSSWCQLMAKLPPLTREGQKITIFPWMVWVNYTEPEFNVVNTYFLKWAVPT